MKLLIDIGNQRVKWATSEQLNVSVRRSVASQRDVDKIMRDQIVNTHSTELVDQLGMQLRKLPAPESVWVSCVSAEFIRTEVVKMCQLIWKLSPICIRAEAEAAGVENGYEDPVTLGVDRWAANVGARHTAGGASLVVIDAGTAVTIDYINREGRFLGGIIFPGVVTMIESLYSATGQIQAATRSDTMRKDVTHVQIINTNTQSAVENGVVLTVVAGIDKAIDQYRLAEDGELKIIITGGDAEYIASLSMHNMKYEPNLVLIGLLLLSEEAP